MTELVGTKEAISMLGCTPGIFKGYIRRGNLSPDKKAKGKSYFKKEKLLNFNPPSPTKHKKSVVHRSRSSGLERTDLADIVEKWRVNSRDTSSADVQIGIYTEKIKDLEDRIRETCSNDESFKHMRYTLLQHVGERRKLLHYLEISDYGRYRRAMELINKESRAS